MGYIKSNSVKNKNPRNSLFLKLAFIFHLKIHKVIMCLVSEGYATLFDRNVNYDEPVFIKM